MSIGFVPPAGPGGFPWFMGEPFSADPSVAPGLARPIGWEVRMPDGTGAWFKTGLADTDWTPFGGLGGAKFLSQAFANGVADVPAADNVFGMANRTFMYWQSTSNPEQLPYQATMDSASGTVYAASGLPAVGWSLATVNGTFGRVFTGYNLFDLGWDGTFTHIGSQGEFTVEEVNYRNVPMGGFWDRTNLLASRDYNSGVGWPESFPFPPAPGASGAEAHELALFNTATGLVTSEVVDGWGQTRYGMWPIQHGITWQWVTHAKWDEVAGGTAVGDGVGWGVFEHDLNHPTNNPRGGLTCTAQDLVGNWQWSFLLANGLGGFADVADFAASLIELHSPLQVDQAAAFGSASFSSTVAFTGALPQVDASYTSALIDLTTAADNLVTNIPSLAGWFFFPRSISFVATQFANGPATAGFTVDAGNNVGHTNAAHYTLSTVGVNAIGAVIPVAASGGSTNISAQLDTATPIVLKVTSPATGGAGFTLKGHFRIDGTWMQLP